MKCIAAPKTHQVTVKKSLFTVYDEVTKYQTKWDLQKNYDAGDFL